MRVSRLSCRFFKVEINPLANSMTDDKPFPFLLHLGVVVGTIHEALVVTGP